MAQQKKKLLRFLYVSTFLRCSSPPPLPPVPRLVAKRLDLMYMLCYVCVCHSRATVEYCNLLSLISNALPFRYTIRWLRLYSNTQLGPPHLHFPRVSISEGPISSTSATHKTIQPRKPTLCAWECRMQLKLAEHARIKCVGMSVKLTATTATPFLSLFFSLPFSFAETLFGGCSVNACPV